MNERVYPLLFLWGATWLHHYFVTTTIQHSITENESTERRQQYVLDLANISEDKDDDKKAKFLREMAKQEWRDEAYARLGFARGKTIKQQKKFL